MIRLAFYLTITIFTYMVLAKSVAEGNTLVMFVFLALAGLNTYSTLAAWEKWRNHRE